MNRRAFFAGLLAAGTAGALDPERLLWTPGAKLISIPAPRFSGMGMLVDYEGGGFPDLSFMPIFGHVSQQYTYLRVGESRTLYAAGKKMIVARVQEPSQQFNFQKAMATYNRIPK